jgi:hypothetical protein
MEPNIPEPIAVTIRTARKNNTRYGMPGNVQRSRPAKRAVGTDLLADLIRDCSRRNGIILDPFGGSGTTILAAERTGRIARVIEIDPLYVDLAVRRCEQTTGIAPRHAELGLNLTDLAKHRATPEPSSEPRYPEVIPSGED